MTKNEEIDKKYFTQLKAQNLQASQYIIFDKTQKSLSTIGPKCPINKNDDILANINNQHYQVNQIRQFRYK